MSGEFISYIHQHRRDGIHAVPAYQVNNQIIPYPPVPLIPTEWGKGVKTATRCKKSSLHAMGRGVRGGANVLSCYT